MGEAGGRPHAPPADCGLCPRLVAYRRANAARRPDWRNAPVGSFGGLDSRLLVVGLAPGLSGANRTGRPFTGDAAGDVLYPALQRRGFAAGRYGAEADDGLRLVDCRITNAARCAPPQNRPTGAELRACRGFLAAEIAAMPRLRAILALGRIAHDSVLAALGARRAALPFAHGAIHELDARRTLFDSYHCSRYNMNTRRLTAAMFDDVVGRAYEAVQAAREAGEGANDGPER